jgi:tetratricopeptide (TPR) repeat protein
MLFLSPEYRENFGKFLMALHRGAPAADACQSAFGKPASVVFADARAYFDRRKLVGRVFQIPPHTNDVPPAKSPVNDFDSRLLLADLQAAIGRNDLTRLEYERLEKTNPSHADLQRSMGYLFIALRDAQQTKLHFEKAFAAGATDAKLCFALALMQIASREPYPKIAATLERAVTTDPGFTDALMQLGVVRSLNRDFRAAVDAFMAIPTVTADRAPSLFHALSYAWLETGDVEQARTHLATARKYSQKPAEAESLDKLEKLIEARARSAFAPRPGEQIVKVEGTVIGIDCGKTGQKMQLQLTAGTTLALDIPETEAIEVVHEGKGSLQLGCGRVPPLQAVIEYARASAMRQDSAGVIRMLRF